MSHPYQTTDPLTSAGRRQLVASASAALTCTPILTACSQKSREPSYESMVAQTWRTDSAGALPNNRLAIEHELVRFATLAPSSHNTQCWKFAVQENSITILPDFSRRCPAVDPDDHHLFVSLGCAVENLAHAALAHGFHAQARLNDQANAIDVALPRTAAQSSPSFYAIASRQCTRGDYDGKPLTNQELGLLEQAGTSDQVRVLLLTERAAVERVLDFVIGANTAQMSDPAFVKELKSWIRFNGAQAVQTRDGLFSLSSGNPSIPTWLGERAFGLVFKPKSENDKYAHQIRSSAGIAIFVGAATTKANWVEVGRCYERFALQGTALGIRNALLNQPVEVACVRSPFASTIGLSNQRPDLVVRFGHGPILPQSLRRPVQSVLV
jgi:hypothetical protein